MGAPLSDFYYCKAVVRGLGKSWTERYELGDPGSRASAVTIGTNICKARRLVLAEPFQIAYGSIHKHGGKRDRSLVVNNAVGPLDLLSEAGPPIAIESTNDSKSCIFLAFETPEGYWVNRFVGGARDSWITGNVVTVVPTPYTAPLIPGTHLVAGLTEAVAFGNFIGVLRDYVKLIREDPTSPGTFLAMALPNWVVRGVTTRDRGATALAGRGRSRVLANA